MLPVFCRKAAWVPSGASALLKLLLLATRPAPLPGICALVNVHGELDGLGLYMKAPSSVVTSWTSNPESGTLLFREDNTTSNGEPTGTESRFEFGSNTAVKAYPFGPVVVLGSLASW